MTGTPTDPDETPRIAVLSGFHASACCRLPLGACSIGSDATDAVILGDPGILPGHLKLDVQEASATLRAAHDGVVLDGVEMPAGSHVAAAMPFELALAGVVLRFEAAPPGAEDTGDGQPADAAGHSFLARFRPALRPARRLVALACAVAAVGVLMPGVNSIASGTGRAVPPTAEASTPRTLAGTSTAVLDPNLLLAASASPGTVRTPPLAASPGPTGLALALQDLQTELSARSLAGVQLSASGGMITARGRLDPRSEPEWRLAQQWFDGRYARYGREATLVDEIHFAAIPVAAVTVDAVWTGRNSNVVIKGQKYFEGATLPNGFHLERIASGELHVEREGQRQVLRF